MWKVGILNMDSNELLIVLNLYIFNIQTGLTGFLFTKI